MSLLLILLIGFICSIIYSLRDNLHSLIRPSNFTLKSSNACTNSSNILPVPLGIILSNRDLSCVIIAFLTAVPEIPSERPDPVYVLSLPLSTLGILFPEPISVSNSSYLSISLEYVSTLSSPHNQYCGSYLSEFSVINALNLSRASYTFFT